MDRLAEVEAELFRLSAARDARDVGLPLRVRVQAAESAGEHLLAAVLRRDLRAGGRESVWSAEELAAREVEGGRAAGERAAGAVDEVRVLLFGPEEGPW